MKKTKKNNKGFSLVELIVVVLIMAILAVALAPQVMKWVGNSKVAADINSYDSLVANLQLALADSKAYDENKALDGTADAKKVTFEMTSSGTAIKSGSGTSTELVRSMNALDPSWGTIKAKNGDSAKWVIDVYAGTVHKTTPPTDTME